MKKTRKQKKQRHKIKSPIKNYLGGKTSYAQAIIKQFSPHKYYVEPFGGSGAVLFQKEPIPPTSRGGEVFNDLNLDVVQTFRMMRDQPKELSDYVEKIPYAMAEYDAALNAKTGERVAHISTECALPIDDDDPIKVAAFFLLRFTAAFRPGGDGSGWLYLPRAGGVWNQVGEMISTVGQRFKNTIITCTSWQKTIERYDSPETLFYLDPPYPGSARGNCKYPNDMETDESHRELAEHIREVEGMVVLSGFPCELYDELFGDWRQLRLDVNQHGRCGSEIKPETIWFSPNCKQVQSEMDI